MNNPLRQLISDDLYLVLQTYNLLNTKVLRDIEIKRRYQDLRRKQRLSSMDAIQTILSEYPYLQFDTVRKIIYSIRLPEEAACQ
jgi:hypothetical protein